MSIPANATSAPLPKPIDQVAFVDSQTGTLTSYGAQLLSAFRSFIVGMNRTTPCSASGTNVISLQPNAAFPLLEKYVDYETFSFVAANTSTGAVTMTVVPATGALATLKAYVDNGATQANSGDLTAGRHYTATFVDSLDSGAGGFVLR